MLYLDTETFSELNIKAVGTYKYAASAELLLFPYAINDEPARLWDRTLDQYMPIDLEDALNDSDMDVTAHYAMFDRLILLHTLGIEIPIHRWRCTMVKAYAHGFPGKLEVLCKILNVSTENAKLSGSKLINRFCTPAPKNHKADRYTSETHSEEWKDFCKYGKNDITSMREVDHILPDWNYRNLELDLYHLDQIINDRGFRVDTKLVSAGIKAAITEKQILTDRFQQLTNGEVEKPTQRAKFQEYLNKHFDLGIDNTQSNTFQTLLDDKSSKLPDDCKELMQICMQSNKTSTAKYAKLGPAVCSDGRFRGSLQFDGAARTRRWSGRTFQPHNLPARGLPSAENVELYIRALKSGVYDLTFDDLMLYGSAALRGVLVSPKGKKLFISDLKNIEGRANTWLADEQWKIEAFEAYDRGDGPDLYNVTAGELLGKDPNEVTKTARNIMGKVPELALGYEGGVGAFQQFSKAYGVQMADHWETIQKTLPRKFCNQAKENYNRWGYKSGLDYIEWIASETVKLAWRDRHPAIVRLWKSCKVATENALLNPNSTFKAGKLFFKSVRYQGNRYLLMQLPSGNFLVYFDPKLERDNTISYMGKDALTGQWTRIHTYGGKLVENACQSLSRDIMAYNMPKIEKAGFEIVLTVHDEVVTEADQDKSIDELNKILATNPPWLKGFPLAADGFECQRYRKDG